MHQPNISSKSLVLTLIDPLACLCHSSITTNAICGRPLHIETRDTLETPTEEKWIIVRECGVGWEWGINKAAQQTPDKNNNSIISLLLKWINKQGNNAVNTPCNAMRKSLFFQVKQRKYTMTAEPLLEQMRNITITGSSSQRNFSCFIRPKPCP